MKTIATICARGGSFGLPNKNILDFCGKPLIAHTIEQALVCEFIDDVYVSTDSKIIADIAFEYGAKIPFIRPEHLATDEIGKLPVIKHCVEYLQNTGENIGKIIDLQPTSPLRAVVDIRNCFELLTQEVDVVFSACEPAHNPYFSMVEFDEKGYGHLSKSMHSEVVRRQDVPIVYGLNGAVYVWHTHTLSKGLWGGKLKCYVMPKERSVDIDDEIDFYVAEKILKFGREM